MLIPAITVLHVILVMVGYVGLIAANLWLLSLARSDDATLALAGVRTWRRMARTFGPILGAGVLAGLSLAMLIGIPLAAVWLLVTYALIVIALATQAALMVPWQLRAERLIAAGTNLPVRPVFNVTAVFCVTYVAITSLMLIRP